MPCTVKSLLSGNSNRNCEYIIPPGTQTHHSEVENMVYKECGKPCHFVKIERNCPAVGCYCKDGYMLNTTTGKCYKEKCPPPPPPPPDKLPDCNFTLGELHSCTYIA